MRKNILTNKSLGCIIKKKYRKGEIKYYAGTNETAPG